MAIPIKQGQEIKIMRRAGKLLAEVMKKIVPMVRRDVSALELDEYAEKLILAGNARPAFKGYNSKGRIYPATLCVSINNQVVHGIPTPKAILKDGDIVGLDCGLVYQGYFADMAVTLPVGKVSRTAKKLIKVTEKALDLAIKNIKPGIHLGDISALIQAWVEKNGFSVIRELSGHGIGRELHEEPTILNFGSPGIGPVLEPGMTLCFEPMVNAGDWRTRTSADGWTVVTADGGLSAHFEHTILVTEKGAEILTK